MNFPKTAIIMLRVDVLCFVRITLQPAYVVSHMRPGRFLLRKVPSLLFETNKQKLSCFLQCHISLMRCHVMSLHVHLHSSLE